MKKIIIYLLLFFNLYLPVNGMIPHACVPPTDGQDESEKLDGLNPCVHGIIPSTECYDPEILDNLSIELSTLLLGVNNSTKVSIEKIKTTLEKINDIKNQIV